MSNPSPSDQLPKSGDNGVSQRVRVVDKLSSLVDLETFDACALEGVAGVAPRRVVDG